MGEQMLEEAIELQALKNQCYLELKYQKEENAPTISKQKGGKWGGTVNIIGLGKRCLGWKKCIVVLKTIKISD